MSVYILPWSRKQEPGRRKKEKLKEKRGRGGENKRQMRETKITKKSWTWKRRSVDLEKTRSTWHTHSASV